MVMINLYNEIPSLPLLDVLIMSEIRFIFMYKVRALIKDLRLTGHRTCCIFYLMLNMKTGIFLAFRSVKLSENAFSKGLELQF